MPDFADFARLNPDIEMEKHYAKSDDFGQ